MSFCPSKDIHSVYLDNELPEVYKAEYEDHVKNCPACQKELNNLKAIRTALKADSDSIKIDDEFMEKSYDRLMIKMAYSKNSSRAHKESSVNWKYVSIAAAAAAVFAFVIPFGLKDTPVVQNTALASSLAQLNSNVIAANNVSLGSGRNVLVSGNIDTVNHSSTNMTGKSQLVETTKDVEVLRPNLEDETISIRISVPGLGDIPVTAEINVPMDLISGNF